MPWVLWKMFSCLCAQLSDKQQHQGPAASAARWRLYDELSFMSTHCALTKLYFQTTMSCSGLENRAVSGKTYTTVGPLQMHSELPSDHVPQHLFRSGPYRWRHLSWTWAFNFSNHVFLHRSWKPKMSCRLALAPTPAPELQEAWLNRSLTKPTLQPHGSSQNIPIHLPINQWLDPLTLIHPFIKIL